MKNRICTRVSQIIQITNYKFNFKFFPFFFHFFLLFWFEKYKIQIVWKATKYRGMRLTTLERFTRESKSRGERKNSGRDESFAAVSEAITVSLSLFFFLWRMEGVQGWLDPSRDRKTTVQILRLSIHRFREMNLVLEIFSHGNISLLNACTGLTVPRVQQKRKIYEELTLCNC